MELPIAANHLAILDQLAGQVGYSPEVEAAARKLGFKNATEAIAWQANEARRTGGTVDGGGKKGKDSGVKVTTGSKGKGAPPPQNGGPAAGLFGWVDSVSRALGGK